MVAPTRPMLPVMAEDVIAADLDRPFVPPVAPPRAGSEPVLAWVVVPAAPRAGGHTTLYRIVNHLQAHGYVNRVYFYDVNNVDLEYYRQVLRRSYGFSGHVGNTQDGIADADAVIATSWQTAYPVFNARCLGKRCYFVQDFEAEFYAVGSLSELALNTYRMGLHAITAGPWLADKLRTEFGMAADSFPFGSDGDIYSRTAVGPRPGVAFYARPEVARRGFEIGMMALELFASRHPAVEIHLYGQRIDALGYRFHNHGRASPQELNALYNRCRAGLSLSLTNTSLVPHEMLAAGCIPVVNDSPNNRIVLDNPFVRYRELDPAISRGRARSDRAAARFRGPFRGGGGQREVNDLGRRRCCGRAHPATPAGPTVMAKSALLHPQSRRVMELPSTTCAPSARRGWMAAAGPPCLRSTARTRLSSARHRPPAHRSPASDRH